MENCISIVFLDYTLLVGELQCGISFLNCTREITTQKYCLMNQLLPFYLTDTTAWNIFDS